MAKMESNSEMKEGRFPKTYSMCVRALFKIKGSLAGKEVIISIDPAQNNNYVSIECANQLVILESNIIKMIDSMNK